MSSLLTAEQQAELDRLNEDRRLEAAYVKAAQIKGKSRRDRAKIRLGKEGEIIADEELATDDDSENFMMDADDMDNLPVSSRAAREEAIARRLGLDTSLGHIGPHVADSGVGYGRSGHSPERAYVQGTSLSPSGEPRGLTLPVYKARSEVVLREFFLEGDVDEARRTYGELDTPFFGYEFVRRALQMACERSDREREMASRLLSTMTFAELPMESVGKGFERLFETIDQLEVDVPGARAMAAKFAARAVCDEILPPGFLTHPIVASVGGDIVEDARSLLSMRHSAERLEHCWGVTSNASIPELKAAVLTALKEYYVEGDMGEACVCLGELQAPYFMHEAVYRALLLAVDQAAPPGDGVVVGKALALLGALKAKGVVTDGQMVLGFTRLHKALPDAQLDNPHAAATFGTLVTQAVDAGLLPQSWRNAVAPSGAAGSAAGTATTTGRRASGDAFPAAARTATGATPVEPAKPTLAKLPSPAPLDV